MQLTKDNYFSLEAEREYISCSQYQNFLSCEAKAMAKINGLWIDEPSKELLVGSYVHSWNEGTRKEFIAEHPEMFTKQGTLRAEYQQADTMIAALENDEFCMATLEGEKEVTVAVEMFGIPWKVRFDVYNPGKHRAVDLKTTKSIHEKNWSDKIGAKVSFVETYDYLMRAAVYCEVERLANGRPEGDWLDFYIVAVSKEDPPDKAIIKLTDPKRYQIELENIRQSLTRIKLVKSGILEPIRCEHCNYCRATKKVDRVIHYSDL